jgi:hypothetical protein
VGRAAPLRDRRRGRRPLLPRPGSQARPARCAPFGLDRTNCVVYRDADDLLAQVDALDAAAYARLQHGALAWARASTTVVRARAFLAACGLAT